MPRDDRFIRISGAIIALSILFAFWGVIASADSESAPSDAELREASRARVDLGALLASFRAMPGLEARFTEEKKLALLARPLKSEGTIYFLPGVALLRATESPKKSEILIAGDYLTIRESGRDLEGGQAGKIERLDLRAMHAVRPLVEGLLMLFTGDRAALERAFSADLKSEGAEWELQLAPKDSQLAHLLERMTIRGSGYLVRTIVIKERSGDESTMRILEANPRRRFSAEERASLFGDAGS